DVVGSTIGVTRARVGQIQNRAEGALRSALNRYLLPEVRAELTRILDDHPAIADNEVRTSLGTASGSPMAVALRVLGVARPRSWAGDLTGWWTRRPGALDVRLRDLAAQAPFTDDELDERAEALGLRSDLPLRELLTAEGSPIRRGPAGGWVRH